MLVHSVVLFLQLSGERGEAKPNFHGHFHQQFFLQQNSVELVVVHLDYLTICMGTL